MALALYVRQDGETTSALTIAVLISLTTIGPMDVGRTPPLAESLTDSHSVRNRHLAVGIHLRSVKGHVLLAVAELVVLAVAVG